MCCLLLTRPPFYTYHRKDDIVSMRQTLMSSGKGNVNSHHDAANDDSAQEVQDFMENLSSSSLATLSSKSKNKCLTPNERYLAIFNKTESIANKYCSYTCMQVLVIFMHMNVNAIYFYIKYYIIIMYLCIYVHTCRIHA